MKALGIIPARGGSKEVRRKNIRVIAGKPLIAYTIEAAKGCHLLTRFVVSTDDGEIATVAEQYGAPVLMRPSELAADDTPMIIVVEHVLKVLREKNGEDYEYVVLLQPTTPLRKSYHIDEALNLLYRSDADSVVSVVKVPGHYNLNWQFIIENGKLKLFTGKPLNTIVKRRQDLPVTYARNGALYACKTESPLKREDLYGDTCLAYIMTEEDSVNIDSEQDVKLAEQLLIHQIRCHEKE